MKGHGTGLDPVFTSTELQQSQSAKHSASRSSSKRKQRFSHNDFCFSRVSPLQKQRIEQVEMIEQALKKHPLALYPHLEECIPPEVVSNDIVIFKHD